MKQFFSIFMVFSISVASLSAQTVGLRVGANLSNLKLDQASLTSLGISKESLLGLALAIPVEFKVHKNVSIQTELGFLQKGFKSVQSVKSGTSTIKSELSNYANYASIPVMLKLHSATRLIQVYVNVGPDAAWHVSSKQTGQTATTIDNGQATTTNSNGNINIDGQKRLAIGLQGGAGAKLSLGKWGVVLDGRFLTDLKNQNNSFNLQGLKDKATNTQGWMTSLGLVMSL
jgi:Outer membrane protein beta-barrel domain